MSYLTIADLLLSGEDTIKTKST